MAKKKINKKIKKPASSAVKQSIRQAQEKKSNKVKAVKKVKKITHKTKKKLIPIGGMAFGNGLMLRSFNFAVLALKDDIGKIEVFSFSLRNTREKYRLFFIPFLRGIFFVLENVYYNFRALSFKKIITKKNIKRKPHRERWSSKISNFFFYLINLLLLIGIFDYLYIKLNSQVAIDSSRFFLNFIFSLLYILFFAILFSLVYMGRKEESEFFYYHAVEHKVINAYEKDHKVDEKTFSKAPNTHNRCGVTVYFWSAVFLSFFVTYFKLIEANWFLGFVVSLGLVFLSISLAYEFVRAVNNSWFFSSIFIKPLDLIQYLTCHEPDKRHLKTGQIVFDELIRLEKEAQ